ncbi:MAG: hypothetical protein ACXWZD_01340 [Actinomycetota bacterium]
MTTRRVSRALLSLFIAAMPCLTGTPIARAQDQTDVTLRLVAQTAWTTLKDPVLSVTIEARNDGTEPIGDLQFGITLGPTIRSRTLYDASLDTGPGSFPVSGDTASKKGELVPGEPRLFSYDLDLSTVGGVSTIDSGVYPLQVDLRSGGVPLASLNSAAIHLVRKPEQPLRLSWWAEVAAPNAFDPDGHLADTGFETSIAEGGALATEVDALLRIAEDPDRAVAFDLVLRPSTLEQLSRMRDGYARTDGSSVGPDGPGARDATRVLDGLSRLVQDPAVEPSAMPFSAPLLPSLLATATAPDVTTQLSFGRQTVAATMGTPPAREVLRPPAGALDDPTIATLSERGIHTILGNPDTIDRPDAPNTGTPLATARLATTGGEEIDAVLPDPGVADLLADPTLRADPILAAQVTLGALATIWREMPVPVPPAVRGVAVDLPADLPAGIWGPLTRRLADAPFLLGVTARQLVHQEFPVGDTSALAAPSDVSFPRTYADAIRDARRRVDGYASMLEPESPTPDRLRRNLLMAESGEYVEDLPAGARWIAQVDAVTAALFERAAPDTSQSFTLAAREGTIPIRMGDPGGIPITVELQFRSSRFTFPDGDRQTVQLTGPNQIVNLRVIATGSGPGTIEVVTRAPNNLPLHQQQLVVRVTAVNRIALIITGGAALLLAGLWVRRVVRRRT